MGASTEGTPVLIIVLLLLIILIDWLGTTSFFDEAQVVPEPSAATIAPSQAQVIVVPTPAPGRESDSAAPLAFTSGNFAYDATSFHYRDDAPRWVHDGESPGR